MAVEPETASAPKWSLAGQEQAGNRRFDGGVGSLPAGLAAVYNQCQALPILGLWRASAWTPHQPFPDLCHPSHEADDGGSHRECMHAALQGARVGV